MRTSILSACLLLAPFFYACSPSGEQQTSQASQTQQDTTVYQLIGKKLLLDYGTMQAKVAYLTEETLHWEITLPDGNLSQGDERPSYQRLSPSSFFVSWIEADGTSVSQVLDLKEKSVKAYLTMSADSTAQNARGGRTAQLIEGTISEQP